MAPARSQALAAPGLSPVQATPPLKPATSPQTDAVVTVRIVHSLEEGELSIWSDDRLLLEEPLKAVEMDVEALGTDLFSYRKEKAEWLLQVPPGRRSLRVRVESVRAGVSLVKELTQQVDADGRYTFEIRVRSFPRPHLALDWEAS